MTKDKTEIRLDNGDVEGARFDRASFRGDAKRTDEGYIRADAIVTRTGILLYADSSMPDGVRRELRHPDDVFALDSLESLKQIPITLDHPVTPENPRGLLNSTNVDKFQVGYTGDNVRPIESKFVASGLTVTADKAVKSVESGTKELSLGYTQRLVRQDGEYDGQRYTHRQTRIRYNHLAIVDKARAGAMARITLDKEDAIEIDKETADLADKQPNGSTPMDLVKITLDGGRIVEVPEAMANAYAGLRERLDTAEAKTKDLVEVTLDGGSGYASKPVAEALAGSKAKVDDLQAKLDKAEKTDPVADNKRAHERMTVMDKAKRVLDKDTLGKITEETLNLDIMEQVVIEATPKDGRDAIRATLDSEKKTNEGTYPVYVKARFDALTLPEGKQIDAQRGVSTERMDGNGNNGEDVKSVSGETTNLDKAKDDYMYRLTHGGKSKAEVEGGK